MQKFGILAATAMTSSVNAYRNISVDNNPFTGEHTDAGVIQSENRTTHRASPVADTRNKYDAIISKINKEPYKSPEMKLYEMIFGVAEKPQANGRQKRLGAQRASVRNNVDDLFAIDFYMGNILPMSGLVDNATDLIAVEGASCKGSCAGVLYDIENNLDSKVASIEPETVTQTYGTTTYDGRYAKDLICLDLGKCVELEFLYVDKQYSSAGVFDENIDAILGFARPGHPFMLDPGSVKRQDFSTMYLTALEAYPEEPIFSTHFKRTFISYIDIGTPQRDAIEPGAVPATLEVFDDFFWSTTLQGVRYGTRRDKSFTFDQMDEYGSQIGNGIYTFFDTGATDILLSDLWFESFVEQLYGSMGMDYAIEEGIAQAQCAGNYPDLYFMLNNYWLQVKPDDYLKAEELSDICSLKIKGINAPFNIMGMPAYIGYYIQHNWKTGTMTFAPYKNSKNVDLQEATSFPENKLRIKYATENTPYGDVISVAIALFICFCAGLFWAYFVYGTWSMGTEFAGSEFTSDTEAAGYLLGGLFAIFISFFILNWLLKLFLWPGNNVQPVPSDGDAIQNVKAMHMGILGLLSYFLYKLCGKKKQIAKKEASTVPESSSAAEIDDLINTIE